MSTLALGASEAEGRQEEPARRSRFGLVRHIDLLVLAAALPVFIALDLPIAGYVAMAVAWIVQRTVMFWAERRVASSLEAGDRKTAMGVTGASTLGRAWFLAACVLLIGLLAEREAGLAAAVLVAVLFTVQLGSLALVRLFAGDRAR